MGADGGTIPKRCELVKTKKKTEKVEKAVKNAVKWTTCRLSTQQLKKPICADKLGKLYNKEAIIEGRLNKTLSKNPITAHIKSLSDVKELKLTENKGYKNDGPDKGDVYKDLNNTPYVCPITGLNMNGTYNFAVNWECGCVFSEKAMQEVKTETCYGCAGPFDKANVIQLNAEGDLLKEYEARITAEQAAKKAKKAAAKIEGEVANELEGPGPEIFDSEAPSSSSSSVVKVKSEKIKEKAAGNKRKVDTKLQDDPNVSKAFKSIFTSSEGALNQPKAHWVTHNPLYF